VSVLDSGKGQLTRLQRTRPWRAWTRYGDVRGNVLAGGISYFAFFSIFPAVALAFTVFGFLLQDRPDLLQTISAGLQKNLPGFVKDANHPNGIIPVEAPGTGTLTVTGLVALGALVLAGLGWIGALRDGIRAVFGVEGAPGNLITNKLRDLGVLVTIGLGIAVSAILTSMVGGAAGWVARHVGLGDNGWVVTLAGILVGVAADTGLMILLLRFLSGVALPTRDLVQGALVGGVGFTVLKLLGARLVSGTMSNPLFASIALVVGLLLWLNLIARLTLLSAAWAANDVGSARDAAGLPMGPSTPAIPVARPGSLPTFGARAADRTTLAAGAVLGATGAMAVGSLVRGVAGVFRRER
jgi:membrane protein